MSTLSNSESGFRRARGLFSSIRDNEPPERAVRRLRGDEMSTLPEISKLNWSYEKPEFCDIEGKIVLVECETESINKSKYYSVFRCFDKPDIHYFNRGGFVRYAIIDISEPNPEPLEYQGEMPEIRNYNDQFCLSWGTENRFVWSHTTPYFATKAEAIRAWNEFVRKEE